jgi:adenylyl-sulfate kinase
MIHHSVDSNVCDEELPPYGGAAWYGVRPETRGPEMLERLRRRPQLALSESEYLDLTLLGNGGHAPLTGFMNRQTYEAVRDRGRLPDGTPWGWPVTLAVSDAQAAMLRAGDDVALVFGNMVVGVLQVSDLFPWDAAAETTAVHDGVSADAPEISQRVRQGRNWLVGGDVQLIRVADDDQLCPVAAREYVAEQAWYDVVALLGIRPWHRNDEQLMRHILETSDALMPLLPSRVMTEREGLPESATGEAAQLVFRNSLAQNRILANKLTRHIHCSSARMLLQYAILAQNYGCRRLYVMPTAGIPMVKDDAKVSSLIRDARRSGLMTSIHWLPESFYCERCGTTANDRTCAHGASDRVHASPASLAENLLRGDPLPPQLLRPEVARLLSRAVSHGIPATRIRGGSNLYPHVAEVGRETREMMAGHRAAVLWLTGLSGSGKSTIAHKVERQLLLSGHRVYVLDGDTLRTGLCADLGFSREARQENLRRAAELAKVMRDAGLIVIASFISPFRDERATLVDIIGDNFYEVYVEASVEACEARDPKGLYKRARAGVIPEFTGVSAPYEPPEKPALRVNTENHSVDECTRSLIYGMERFGLLRRSANDVIHGASLSGTSLSHKCLQ